MIDFGMMDESPDEDREYYQEEADRRARRRNWILTCEYCGHSWKVDGEYMTSGSDMVCPNCKKLWNR